MSLTPKQAEFCRQYLIDLNATQAAIRAGYSVKTAKEQAARLLTNVNIQSEISQMQVAREKRTEITQDYVLSGLKKNFERAMQFEPVRDSEGNETGEFRYEGSVANRALELMGKHLGMFADRHKHEVTGKDGGPVQTESAGPDLKKMSRDELRTYLAALRAAASGGSGGSETTAGG